MKKLVLAATLALVAGSAYAAAPVVTVETEKGAVLAGDNGMTLYTFRKDAAGMSNCYDKCAENWPPLMADEAAMADGEYSIIERTDGGKQWAKEGMPLYFWVKDEKMGDITGDGVKDAWHIAQP